MADSTITIVGNATADPELRFTQSGRGVASMNVAVNRRYQRDGEWQEEVSFIGVTCWGDLGENVASSIQKGTRVIVTGRINQRSWEDRETGAKRSILEIVADSVGPDLRWATAEVHRITRDSASSGGKSGDELPEEEPF